MPNNPIVSADDVAEAAAQLLATGRPVSGGALRSVLGHGRPDRLFALWREQQPVPAQQPAPTAPELPPALDDQLRETQERHATSLAALFGAAWATAHELAQARIAAEVDGARKRVEAITAERDEALAAVDDADERVVGLQRELDAERQGRAGDAGRHGGELAVVREEAVRARADADAVRAVLDGMQGQVAELIRRVPVACRPEATAETAK